MKQAFILFFIWWGCILNIQAQTPIEEQLKLYRAHYLPEKVFVHTDKRIYAAGETIWMAVYLLDGQTHKPGAFSVFSRVELLNSQTDIITKLKVFLPEGQGSGSIDLPRDLPSGDYQLIAYTNYQLNSAKEAIFRKNLKIIQGINTIDYQDITPQKTSKEKSIISAEKAVNLRFFPEGGACVEGLPCVVAMVAEDMNGNPVITEGVITDQNKQPITFFKTNELGMGTFSYTPKSDFTGYAWLSSSDINFSLPKALKEGYVLSIREENTNIQIVLRSNLNRGLKGARIAIHHRGVYFLDQKLSVNERATILNIPQKDFHPGVYVVTVFDHQNLPVAERLFFIAPETDDSRINIQLDQPQPSTRSQVQITVETPEDLSIPDSLYGSKLSLSIIPETSLSDLSEEDIRTWALLNSDLDLPIPNAARWIFSKDKNIPPKFIHQFLLTRAWRRFTWKALTNLDKDFPLYELERGVVIKGKMTEHERKDRPRPGKVFFAQLDENLFDETLTDEQGNFTLGPYIFFDTTKIILQGRFKLGKKNRLKEDISIDDNPYTTLEVKEENHIPEIVPIPSFQTKTFSDGILKTTVKEKDNSYEYGKLSRNMLVISRNFDSLLFQMEAVKIAAKRTQPLSPIEKQRKERSFLYNNNPSYRLVLDSMPGANIGTNVLDLFYRLPGVNINNGQLTVHGPGSFLSGSGPLIIVDGQEVPMDYLSSISVADIEFIDLLKGPDATIYGVRGANGVILIYTRLRTSLSVYKRPPGILDTQIVGFHLAKEFAVFDYENPNNKDRPDIRTTLHWNPQIETNDLGIAKEKFTTSDQKGKFHIIIQGVRKDGQVLFGSRSFEVR